MKTKRYLYALMACAALTFSACDEKNKDIDLGTDPTVDEVDQLPYSDLTPEQQKEKLAAEANAFIEQMKGLSDQPCYGVMEALYGKMDTVDTENLPEGLGKLVEKLQSAEGITQISEVYGTLALDANNALTWTANTPADMLLVTFPEGKIEVSGTESSKTNEGMIVPRQVSVKIYSGTSECGSIKADADVMTANDKPGVPATESLTLTLGEYSIAQNFTKSDKKATLTLKKGDALLIAAAAMLDGGDLDKLVADDESGMPNGGNFSMALMDNLILVGSIDVANMDKDSKALEAECRTATGFDDEKFAKGMADLYNKYFEVYLASAKDKTKIAKLENKAVKADDGYWYVQNLLRFNDGTPVEASVYFSTGFDTVIENFMEFIQSLPYDVASLLGSEEDHNETPQPDGATGGQQ